MVEIIVAHGDELEIGEHGHLPWPKISADLKHFKNCTVGKTVIMGRKTFESIGSKPLKDRTNIVVTSKVSGNELLVSTDDPNLFYTSKPIELFKQYQTNDEKLVVIGGAELYKQALVYASVFYITKIHQLFPNADTFFPKYESYIKNALPIKVSPRNEEIPKGIEFMMYMLPQDPSYFDNTYLK